MKKLLFVTFVACVLAASMVSAQDIIVLKDGTDIEAIVSRVGTEIVTYKRWNNQTGPDYDVKISDVFLIRYGNGESTVFNSVQPVAQNVNSENGIRIFSVRSEFRTHPDEMPHGAGVTFEFGRITSSGFYVTGTFGGGFPYYGGGVYLGGSPNAHTNSPVKVVIGGNVGAWLALWFGDGGYWSYDDEIWLSHFGGPFVKLMFGKTNHKFDVTNRVLFGVKERVFDSYYGYGDDVETTFNATYSLSIGYTWAKPKQR